MAIVNEEKNELYLKVLYVGSKGSGKTSALQSLYRTTVDKHLPPLSEEQNHYRDSLFEFLPLALGEAQNHFVRLHIYVVEESLFNTVLLPMYMRGVDGIVFCADARMENAPQNLRCWQHLQQALSYTEQSNGEIPIRVQLAYCDKAKSYTAKQVEYSEMFGKAPVMATHPLQGNGVVGVIESLVEDILDNMGAEKTEAIVPPPPPQRRMGAEAEKPKAIVPPPVPKPPFPEPSQAAPDSGRTQVRIMPPPAPPRRK